MASPVDTTVKHFYSSMQGAPVLAGQAGSLIGLLDACLVTGWGLRGVGSAVISNGVCRLNFVGGKSAAVVDAVIFVEGATPAGLNGEQKVTGVGIDWVEFKTALPDGVVTGALSFKMAPAGWSKVFSGLNKAVYQGQDVQGTRMLLRIDDTGAMNCRLRGYESMSDVDSGAGLFPVDAQMSGGGWMNKAINSNTNAVKWTLVANARTCYLSIVGFSSSSGAGDAGRTVPLGDFQPFRPGGDPYAFVVGCGNSGAYSDVAGVCDNTNAAYHYAPRAYHGLGGSVALASQAEVGVSTVSGMDSTLGVFPSVIDGGLRLSRRMVMDSGTPRGVFTGLYTVPQSGLGMSIAPLTRQAGAGALSGRTLLSIGCGSQSHAFPNASLGISFIDITGPWGY